MDTETKTFWIAVTAVVVVMLAFAAVTVNIWHLLPVVNPFIGGLVSGLLARRGSLGGAREGTVAGVAGGVIVFTDFLLGTAFLQNMTAPMATVAGGLWLLAVIPYSAILALLGGVIGGQVNNRISARDTNGAG